MKKRSQDKPRLHRFIRTVLIFLVLGAMLNVVVAWGAIYLANRVRINVSTSAVFDTGQHGTWRTSKYSCFTTTSVSSTWENFDGLDMRYFSFTRPAEIIPSWSSINQHSIVSLRKKYGDYWYISMTSEARGWPLLCLRTENISVTMKPPKVAPNPNLPPPPLLCGGVVLSVSPFTSTIPYSPLWSGFIFNTFFYGVMLGFLNWGLRRLFMVWQSRRRIRRGLCGGCGYVVSVNAGVVGASLNCTECGTPIPPVHSRITNSGMVGQDD